MESLWPWLVVAGLGALHGSSPAQGWMFAAACGVRARDDAQAWRALVPIAIGHLAAIAIAAGVVMQGLWLDSLFVRQWAGASLIGAATYRALRGGSGHLSNDRVSALLRDRRIGHAGIALWSCLMSTAHGAGWMLIPALAPLCTGGAEMDGITASGSLALAAAAVAVHLGAMLIATGAIATGIHRGVALLPALLRPDVQRHAWTAVLAVTGMVLLVLR